MMIISFVAISAKVQASTRSPPRNTNSQNIPTAFLNNYPRQTENFFHCSNPLIALLTSWHATGSLCARIIQEIQIIFPRRWKSERHMGNGHIHNDQGSQNRRQHDLGRSKWHAVAINHVDQFAISVLYPPPPSGATLPEHTHCTETTIGS